MKHFHDRVAKLAGEKPARAQNKKPVAFKFIKNLGKLSIQQLQLAYDQPWAAGVPAEQAASFKREVKRHLKAHATALRNSKELSFRFSKKTIVIIPNHQRFL